MSLAAKIKVGLALLLVLAVGGVIAYSRYQVRVAEAEAQALQIEVQRKADELAYQKILLEKIKTAITVREKNAAKVKKLPDADVVEQLDIRGWLRPN